MTQQTVQMDEGRASRVICACTYSGIDVFLIDRDHHVSRRDLEPKEGGRSGLRHGSGEKTTVAKK